MGDRDLHLTITVTGRVLRRGVLLLAALALAVPGAVWAGDSFSDVPDSNIFHDDIDWMADNGVTRGCGGDRFCPSDTVTREQMSAFLRRMDTEDVFSRPAEVDAAIGALDEFVPIATLSITPGALQDSSFRAPVTGAPRYVGFDGTLDGHRVRFPGVDLNLSDFVVSCTPTTQLSTTVHASADDGDLMVYVRNAGGTLVNLPADCLVLLD